MPQLGVPVPDLLRLMQAHLFLSGCAVIAGLAIGLPIAIFATVKRRIGAPLLGVISLLQTIPGLALLALFYPLLLFIGRVTGLAVPALGFLPAFLALSTYALLPIVRNAFAAIRGIEPTLLEAADGIGMSRGQRLRLVELPLGAPVILAGVRTAAVWTIGTATLATTIGQQSLGDLIFSGLQTEDWRRVLTGCVAAAMLAFVVDSLLALVESGLRQRIRGRVAIGAILLLGFFVGTFLPVANLQSGTVIADSRTIIVGAKNFSEQYILAELVEDRLRKAGFRTERRDNLGSSVAYRALAADDIDVYVDYSGTLWTNVLARTDTPPGPAMLDILSRELFQRDKVRVLGPLGFENAYAFAMTRSRAETLKVTDLDDLAEASNRLRLATDLEFLNRPEWASIQSQYHPNFMAMRPFSPTFMYRALADGSVDVITAFSSDGRIAAMDLVTLSDPRGALPHYDAVLLLAPASAQNPKLVETLRPLVNAIDISTMRAANWMVDRDSDKRTPRQAAAWIESRFRDQGSPERSTAP